MTSLPVPSFIFGSFGARVGAFRIQEGESPTQIIGITGVDDEGNFIIEKLGDTEPTFRISFYNKLSYMRFNLSFLWDWQQGSNIINLTKLIYDSNLNSRDFLPQGQDRFFGEFVGNTNIGPYIENATYFKLREVTLSYDLPEEWAASIYASGATISLSGRNLLVFSDYWGLDPEVSNFGNQAIARNIDVAPYPPYRSFWLSFDVRF